MTRLLLAAGLLVPLAGCAARRPAPTPPAPQKTALTPPADAAGPASGDAYEPAVAPVLVFNLPEEQFGPPLDLRRGERQPTAFLGFDEGVAEYYSVWTDDRQREDVRYDRFERRAVSVRSGVRYR